MLLKNSDSYTQINIHVCIIVKKIALVNTGKKILQTCKQINTFPNMFLKLLTQCDV